MTVIKTILTTLFVFSIYLVTSQTQPQTSNSSSSLKEEAERGYSPKTMHNSSKSASASGNYSASSVSLTNENDPYQGRREEFEKLFAAKKLPNDFPIYQKSYGISGYNQLIDSYCTQHLNLLNEAVKQKITGHE